MLSNKFLRLATTALILSLPYTAVQAKEANPSHEQAYQPTKEFIISFKKRTSSAIQKQILQSYKTSQQLFHSIHTIRIPDQQSQEIIQRLKKHPNIDYVEPNTTFHANYTPNDPLFANQWSLPKIQAPEGWDITQGISSIKIAIVDTGVQANHPDLSGKVINGYDFVEDDYISQDANGHGTHIAGIAAATTNNTQGISGVAPKVSILAVRVLNQYGSGTLADVASGIRYAADQGAKVINLSLGTASSSQTLKDAVDYAWNKGAVLVAAAGGNNSSTGSYPASYPNVIAVGGTDQNDQKMSSSSYGTSWVDVAAPGLNIISTFSGSTYRTLSGTSMAAAHVSGLAGLLASQSRTASNIRNAIEQTADPVGLNYWKYGRINVKKALLY